MLPLATLQLAGIEKRRRALDVPEKVGLSHKTSRLPSQFSGCEQGRLAISRALVNDPPLLLADEPTGTLDTKTGDEIMKVFLDLNSLGQTIFMVSHNPADAALVHRVLHIQDSAPEATSDAKDARTETRLSPAL